MKTIKIIDLLNKIANGEENDLITEFVFDGRVWNFYKLNHSEFCLDVWLLNQEIKITRSLNDEVEILDVEDEFEDIEEIPFDNGMKTYDISTYHQIERMTYAINQLIKNQKKIIERIKE